MSASIPKNTPTISVMMPAHNREAYIAESIQSVLTQTFKDFELIIIDDASTDRTVEIAETFLSDSRVSIIRNEQNLGIARTRNRVLELAQGTYVAPLDSDDVWLDTDKLQHQYEFLEAHPDHAIIGGGIALIDSNGKTLSERFFPEADQALRNVILRYNPFAQSTLLYRKHAIVASGSYDPRYHISDDYALWLSVGKDHKFATLSDIVTGYRIHGENITHTRRVETARETLTIIKHNASFYPHAFNGLIKAYARLFLRSFETVFSKTRAH